MQSSRLIHRRTVLLLSLALVTWLIFIFLPYGSVFVERYYFNGVYRWLRYIWQWTLAFSPIALIYPLIIGLMGYGVMSWWNFRRLHPDGRSVFRHFINGLLQVMAMAFILFYWLWGFNYKRSDPLHELPFPEASFSEDDLFEELAWVTDSLISLRDQIPESLGYIDYNAQMEDDLRESLLYILENTGISYFGKVRIRLLRPKGSLLRFSTAGVYLPFTGEGQIDPGLHGITWPFTIVHEMSHGYGITGEDSCNFWAFLACINSPVKRFRYSGYFTYWRYVRSNAWRSDPERFKAYARELPDVLNKDLQEVQDYANRYPDIMPALRDLIYDQYLKSHGIPDGLKNYSRIIVLAQAWKERHGSLFISGEN